MAQPSETYDAYDAGTTNADDVQDKIYMVSPESTPVLSSGRRFKANAKYHEWLRDVLAAPSATNAKIEGDERTGTAVVAPTRVGNYTQLMDKVAVISTTQQASKQIGRSNEMKREVAKKMVELKRDLEARLVSSLPAVAGDGSTARQTAGLGMHITTNLSFGSGGAAPVNITTAATSGTARAFTEALVKTVMQSIYTNSGEMASMLVMSPYHKSLFSAFTGIATNRYNIKGKEQATIIGGADLYVGDFGTLTVVPNYVMAGSEDVYILNPETYGVAYLQNFQATPLAKTGHTDKEMVFVEAAVVVTAEASNGKITDLTAS